MFSQSEFDAIKKYIQSGGAVLIMMGEGGEAKWGNNLNYLIEEFGISFNNNSVCRST